MRSDESTVPNLGGYDPGAIPDPDASSGTPTWPTPRERLRRAPGPDRSPHASVSAVLLGVSLCANVVLLMGLLGLLLPSHADLLALGGAAGPSVPALAQSSPTDTPSPTPPAPLSGWLQVTPSSVQLGCDDDQRTQVVILANTGPHKVQWQAVLAGSADQAGVAVDPTQGDLKAGAGVSIKVENATHTSDSQNAASQQGVIGFTATSGDVGSPPSLSYTAMGCS